MLRVHLATEVQGSVVAAAAAAGDLKGNYLFLMEQMCVYLSTPSN